jgi:Polysaccharide deacetylase
METGEAPWYDRIFASVFVAGGNTLEIETDKMCEFSLSTPKDRFAAAWELVCYLRTIPDTARQHWCTNFERRLKPPLTLLEERMLGWDHVRSMQRGGISFGAHTMNHPCVGRLAPDAYHHEFVASKELLEAGLNTPVEDFAYPFGRLTDGNLAAQEFLARAGYRSAATSMEGFNSQRENPYTLRRLQIGDDCSMAMFVYRLSRLFLEANAPHSIEWTPVPRSREVPKYESVEGVS